MDQTPHGTYAFAEYGEIDVSDLQVRICHVALVRESCLNIQSSEYNKIIAEPGE